MAGGLLQLVANSGVEDVYLTQDPQITMFKTIYRRHTNFSKVERDLTFDSNLSFGKEGTCKLHKWGDLLHRLFLVIKLPKADIVYKQLTIAEVQAILSSLGITWTTQIPPDSLFNQQAFNELTEFIAQLEDSLINLKQIYTQMLIKLSPNGIFDPTVWLQQNPSYSDTPIGNNPSDAAKQYYQDVVNDFILYDKYYIEYLFVDAQQKDKKTNPTELFNSSDIQLQLYNAYVAYATSYSLTSYNDDNLLFLLNVETANYIVSGKTTQLDSSTVFRSSIANIYGNNNYLILDAYKIFNQIVINTQTNITGPSDIQNIQTNIIDNIRFDLLKNLKLLRAIYTTLDILTKFIFYRTFNVITTGAYNTASSFNNFSLQTSTSSILNDNFTAKFTLLPEPNQPSDVNHPFSNQVTSTVNTFHLDNRNAYRNTAFSQYFDDFSLWSVLDFATSAFTPGGALPPNMYFLNYAWLIMSQNIPPALNNWLINNNTLQPATIVNLFTILQTVGTSMTAQIKAMINTNDTISTLTTLSNTVKTNATAGGDIVITGIWRPNYFINGQLIPDYIVSNFLFIINNFNAGSDQTTYDNLKPSIIAVINLFITPTANIPAYNDYISRNRNISANSFLFINNVNPSNTNYYDVLSAIFYNLTLTTVANYNNLYNNLLLSFDYYPTNLGIQLTTCLNNIAKMYFLNTNLSYYDYYLNANTYQGDLPDHVTTGLGRIGTEMDNKIADYNTALATYDANRLLLNMTNIIVPKSSFYYEKANAVIDYISTTIENNPTTYQHQHHSDPTQDIVILTKNNLINQLNNAIDIAISLKLIHDEFEAGISTGPNKDALYTQYGQFINPAYYDVLYEWLLQPNGAAELYKYFTLIEAAYDGFMNELDYYNFIKYYTLLQTILKDYPKLLRATVKLTNTAMIDYTNAKITETNTLLDNINGTGMNPVGILARLQNALNVGSAANFAWIRKIGHYIINYVSIQFNDQVIDTQSGRWLDLNHELVKNDKTERGYNKLIGNVDELTVFDNSVKNEYELIIPLQFWFCKHAGLSIPLVALLHTDVILKTKLKPFDELTFFDDFSVFRRKMKLKCSLLAEYIYIDSEERDNFAKSKLEYLIDYVQFNGDVVINESMIEDIIIITPGTNTVSGHTVPGDNTVTIQRSITNDYDTTVRIYFKNLCKELVWCLQDQDNVKNKLWDVYSITINGIEQSPIQQNLIKFNSRSRESYKDAAFYNYIVPYERHQHTPSIGINNYSFSLAPEKYQPSGAANLSRIDDAGIDFILNNNTVYLIKNGKVFVLYVYCVSYNILRICSGLSGLLMFE